jgi:hypothetical protein
MAKHYIYMSGDHGYLPDYCDVSTDHDTAVDSLANLHELGSTRRKRLAKNDYLELELSPIERAQGHHFGAQYCEITECNCDTPWIHSDSTSEDEWNRDNEDATDN